MKRARTYATLRVIGVLMLLLSTLLYAPVVDAAGGGQTSVLSVMRFQDTTGDATGSDGGDGTSGDATGGDGGTGGDGATGGSGSGGDADASGGDSTGGVGTGGDSTAGDGGDASGDT
ncbi:MAG: hypothetical protein ACRDJH_01295, partial [Thermomicrobiales bacterium]